MTPDAAPNRAGPQLSIRDLPLSRTHLNRAAHLRDDNRGAQEALADPRTHVVLVSAGQVAVDPETAATLDLVTPADLTWMEIGPEQWLFLGLDPDDDSPWLAVELPASGGAAVGSAELAEFRDVRRWTSLRDVGATLDVPGTAAEAIALAQWHARNPHCPTCGASTTPASSGWVRVCDADGTEHYPRTDPAVIVTVLDEDDRLLLGHAAQWPVGRYSLLAGFVEPGESFEAAVRREVLEESGIVIGDVAYLASQPWPFPASVMIGMSGRALTREITVDGVEVTEARWVSRDDLAALVDSGEVRLPMRSSIARALIEDWFGGPLAGDW